MNAPDKYGVVGNPIAHSRSPEIHERFARQTRQRMSYERIEVPLEGFEERALALRDAGYRGLNVTVPFKVDAAKLSDDLMPRARLAGAVNTLRVRRRHDRRRQHRRHRLRARCAGAPEVRPERLLGAGAGSRRRGARRHRMRCSTPVRAGLRWPIARTSGPRNWREEFGVEAIHLDEIPAEHFDLIINGTTTGLKHDAPPIDPETFDDCTLAYDLVYAADPTPFMELARSGGAKTRL